MAALCSRQQNSASAGVAGRSVIAGVARLAGSVPPADSPGIAPGPADGCADGGGFGGWLPLWSCIPAACPVPDAGNVRTVWGRIPSQPPTTRHERKFLVWRRAHKYADRPSFSAADGARVVLRTART